MSMTEEEQKAADAEAQAKADAPPAAETDAEKVAREQSEKEAALKKHYEDETARERQAREAAEKSAADLSFKLREQKRDDSEDDQERPLTRSELQSVLDKERQTIRRETQRDSIEAKLKTLATSNAEASLMIEINKTRTFPSHYSLDDIAEEVYAIANRKKMRLERDEALRALAGKDNASPGTGGHHDSQRAGAPQMAEADKREHERLGFSWNGTSRRYEKKLSNGHLLYKDPKTKKVVLVRKSS